MIRFKQLSPARQGLVHLIQNLFFGSVQNLRIESGEPILSPPPAIIRSVKLGETTTPEKVSPSENFMLKREVLDLMKVMDENPDTVIRSLAVRFGLPIHIHIEHHQ